MFAWIEEVKAAHDTLVILDSLKPSEHVKFRAEPNKFQDLEPFREIIRKRFSDKGFLVWQIQEDKRWIVYFKRMR